MLGFRVGLAAYIPVPHSTSQAEHTPTSLACGSDNDAKIAIMAAHIYRYWVGHIYTPPYVHVPHVREMVVSMVYRRIYWCIVSMMVVSMVYRRIYWCIVSMMVVSMVYRRIYGASYL